MRLSVLPPPPGQSLRSPARPLCQCSIPCGKLLSDIDACRVFVPYTTLTPSNYRMRVVPLGSLCCKFSGSSDLRDTWQGA
jgi:hypothetical protein